MKKIPVLHIITVTAKNYGLSIADILERRRTLEIIEARSVAVAIAIEMRPDLTCGIIGKCFRGRDRTTILHARKVCVARRKSDADFEGRYQKIKSIAYQWRPPEKAGVFVMEGRRA